MKGVVFALIVFCLPLFAIGARPLAMGGAFVAIADDLHSIFYNPAGIANIKGERASFMRVLNNRDSMNLKEWAGLSSGMREGRMALSYLHTIDIDWKNGYCDLDYDGKRDDNEPYLGLDEDIAIFTLAGYGEGSLKKTAFGINMRRYSSTLLQSFGIGIGGAGFIKLPQKKSALGFDIGILHNVSKNISLGAAIFSLNEPKFEFENININNISYGLKITHPLVLIAGISLKSDDKTTMAFDLYDLDNINDWYAEDQADRDQSRVRFGLERWVLPNFAVRAGYGGFHSLGFGVKKKNLGIDYALIEDRDGLGFHLLSLMISR